MVWALERQHGLQVAEAYLVLADKAPTTSRRSFFPRAKASMPCTR